MMMYSFIGVFWELLQILEKKHPKKFWKAASVSG